MVGYSANGIPICKGHGKSGGTGIYDDKTSQTDLSVTSDKPGLKPVFASLKRKPALDIRL
jgi:hypothetical protein